MKKSSILITILLITSAAIAENPIVKQIVKAYDEGKYREVITIASRLSEYLQKDDKKSLEDLMGRSYYSLRMYDSTVFFENEAIALDNDATIISGWAYTYRGMALYRQGNTAAAVQDIQKAIDLNKTHNSFETAKEFMSEVKANMVPDDSCAFYFSQGEYKNAIKQGRAQLQKRPYKYVMEIVGASYCDIHYYDSAIYFERAALAMDQDSTFVSGWAHLNLGIALYNENEQEAALTELKAAVELNKLSGSVTKAENMIENIINGRSLVIDSLHQAIKDQLNNGNDRGAANTACAALSAHPEDVLAWDQLATAYCYLHKYDSSIYCGQRTIALDKDQTMASCEAHFHVGIDEFMKGDLSDADNEFTAATNDHTSDNLRKKIKHTRLFTGLSYNYDHWKTVTTNNFVFHFQNKRSIDDLSAFTDKYELEYSKARKVFSDPLPKKIDVFVWEHDSLAKIYLQTDKEIFYTDYNLCVTHVAEDNNRSSEIIHILGFWQKK